DILIREREVPCGLVEQRMEPGYILWNGTVLLESERDDSGCYRAGSGMDGMYLRTPELYRPSYTDDGRLWAFRQVRPTPENYLATAEMSVEGNYNQIDGIINNEAPKPSLLDTLRQCQEDAGKSQSGAATPSPSRDPER
ncbi:MAG: DUF4316 domain-containing protein, partial [Dysosmobacter sp.]|nr:DUF4316 domain-containing protein [Dysosmobacter sp.]